MKKITKKLIAVSLAILTMLSTVTTAMGVETDEIVSETLSSDFSISRVGSLNYCGATLGDFEVTGVSDGNDNSSSTRQAFCIENQKADPTDYTLEDFKESSDVRLARILYYGYYAKESNSPSSVYAKVKAIYGSEVKNDNVRKIITSSALSQVYTGNSYCNAGNAYTLKQRLLAIANDGSYVIPNNSISLTNSNLTVGKKNNIQVTSSTQLKCFEDNSITFTVPNGVTLVNETTNKKVTGGNKAKISANEKFHFEVPLPYSGTINISNVKGNYAYKFSTYVAKSKNSSTQTVGTYCWAKDTTSSINISATFKASTGDLTIIKTSANTELTVNNPCYSLYGAEFKLVSKTDSSKSYTIKTTTKVAGTENYKGTIKNIPIGKYILKEISVPFKSGYSIPNEWKTGKEITISVGDNSVTCSNEPTNDPVVVVTKKTDANGNPLAGAEFTIRYYKGYFTEAEIKAGKADSSFKRYWVIATDDKGRARLDNKYLVDSNNDFYYATDSGNPCLPLGTISIQETKAPDGYIKDDTLYVRQITSSNSGISGVITFNPPTVPNDHIKGELKIVKTSEDDIVTGIKFNIYTTDDKLVGTYTTDSNGYITKELNTGTYKVEEVASNKYNPQPIQTVVVEENKTATVSFSNTLKNGWLEIYKTATDVVNADGTTTAGKVDGIEFEIYDIKDNLIGTYITDKNGLIAKYTIGELKPGTYRVHEIVPVGYIPQKDQTIIIAPNEVRTVHFNNTANGGYVKLIKESDYYDCDTFTLKIEGISNNYKGTVTIDTYEPVEVGLPVGKYKVTEILTDNQKNTWETIEPQEFFINLQQITTITMKNHEKLGSVKVIKSASDNAIKGIKFSLYGLSDMGAEVKYRYATTDSNGVAIFENIPVGTYTLEEISSHTKYNVTASVDMEAVPVKWNQVTEVKVLNDEKSTPVEIYKTTDDGGSLSGFEFEITGTNSAGKYVEYKNLVTDKNGLIKKNLQPGKYTIIEVNVPNKYITPASQTIVIKPTASNSPQPIQVHFENKLKRGGLKVVKTAYDSNIENVSFSLTSVSDSTVYYASTDSNGIATFYEAVLGDSSYTSASYYIPMGKYILREENAGEQYVDIGKIPVTIEYNKTAELAVNNTPKDGYIQIIKTSQTCIVDGFDFNIKGNTWDNKEINKNVTTSNGGKIAEKLPTGTYTITEINVPSWYEVPQPVVINVTPYDTVDSPIQIEVYNKLKTGNGELIKTSEDGIVKGLKFRLYGIADCGLAVDITKTTDENGKIIFDNVYIGKYTLEEIETPVRYNTLKPITVEIKENETTKVTANNTLKVAPAKIIKTSEYGVIENIEFRLVCEKLNYDRTFKTDSKGLITTNLKPGTYTVTELNVPEYAVPQATQTLVVNPYTSDKDIATVRFDNMLKRGKLKVVKTADDNIIESVEFKIWGVSDSGETIEKSVKTNAKGEAEFANLPIGNYMLSEVRQADRYITVIDNNFNINWNETTTILVHNKLKIGEIGTKAKDKATDCGYAYVNKNTTLIDTVSYKNLGTSTKYTIKGVLMDKSTNKPLTINGETIVATKTFTTTENGSGEVDVEFNFDSTSLRGKSVVVFEQLYYGSVELASHKDITDENQTVTFADPAIGTTLTDTIIDGHDSFVREETTLIDKVEYTNLLAGYEYTVKGLLVDKSTGKAIYSDGKMVESQTTFTANDTNGTVDVEFNFNSLDLKGKSVVCYEVLLFGSNVIAEHRDINDEGQTITFKNPTIGTTAIATDTLTHVTYANELTTVIDTVQFTNLIVGKEYTIDGILMDNSTNEPIIINGETVTATKTFIAEVSNGTVNIEFTFDSTLLKGHSIVVFETLSYNNLEIATHQDINDKLQTITVAEPSLGTQAKDKLTELNNTYTSKNTTISDTVKYQGLVLGKSYTIKGYLVDKETGTPIVIDDIPLYAETTFIAESTDGTVYVDFTFDSTELIGKSIVCFEYLYFDNNLIAEHTDINDNGQTITFAYPKIKTTAKDKSTNTNQAYTSTKTTIVDTVKYTGLIIGKEYTVTGVLMSKETGKALLVGGKQVTATKTFKATTENGSVDVEFTFDSSALNNKSVVVFENIYYEENLIATHTDINDKNQTITFTDKEPPTEPGDDIDTDIYKDKISSDVPGDVISTGDDTTVYAVIATVITVICLGIIIISGRKKYDE